MTNQPLVSVIITTYNRVDKISNCIDSVLSQNYKNLEVIVVDDCSYDNTQEYFKKNYQNDLKYIRHDFNQGVQNASNTGYRYCNGKYVAFIGDDDRWSDKNKLVEQVKIFENDLNKKYGVVTTDIKVITKEKKYKKNIKKPKNLVKHILRTNGIIYGSAALIRNDVFKQAGMFAKDLPRGTDSDVFRRIILLGYDVYFISKDMVDYNFDEIDQMTSFDEKGVSRAIISHQHKLQKYGEILKLYSSIRSSILSQLGHMYMLRFNMNKNNNAKYLAKKFLIRSLLANPFNLRSLYLLIKLYFGIK